MAREVSLEDLSKISYFEIKRIDDRVIPLQACFNERGEWEMWLSGPEGLVKMQSMEPIEGHYFAKERVSDADGYLFFSDYMLKHAYYPEVVYYIHAILDDLLNLGASIEKLDLFFTDWLKEHSKVSERFVSTELSIFSTRVGVSLIYFNRLSSNYGIEFS